MIVYRLAQKSFKNDLKGTGAEKYGGRWNNIGTPMLYTCEHQSLCVLEFAVHVQLSLLVQMELYMISIEIPDAPKNIVEAKGLPYEWKQTPPGNISQDFGDAFIYNGAYLGMRVPSAIVQREFNILINPRHILSDKIRIVDEYRFTLDKRLFN